MTPDEFAQVALGHMDELLAFARRLVRHAADADDLLQGTYERAFAAQHELRDARSCRAWLFRIARNLCIDGWRATAARPELRLVESDDRIAAEPTVLPETVERLDAHELEAALSRVPDEQREAVLLSDLWGFEYQEIADITGVPVGTVRSRISRGRARLACIFSDAEALGKGGRGP